MTLVLYWMALSHPSRAARKMVELKGVEYKLVRVLPLNQRVHLRLAGFRGGTVPAIKLDGRRIQGSTEISRALDERWPAPPLFPADAELRRRVEEAERWGDLYFQPIPRRLFRFGLADDSELRRWAARIQRLPAPALSATAMQPLVSYYARVIDADGRRADADGVRAGLASLPEMLDRADRLLEDGTLSLDPPNAATLQVLTTVSALLAFDDLRGAVASRVCAAPARELFGDYPITLPRFLDPEWLEPVNAAHAPTSRR